LPSFRCDNARTGWSSYGERSGGTLLIDLFADGPDIVIKSDFFTAGESARIFEQLKAQIKWRQDVMRFG